MLSVSIITPLVAPSRFLQRALQSVHEQGIVRLQHIIVADGARDDTSAILEPYEPSVIRVSKPFRGQAQAVNEGLARA